MEITDMNGQKIMVTDLGKAIAQAEAFTTYRHEDSSYCQLDARQQEYWKHILEQLTALKNKQSDYGNRIF
ncbi:MAG: hypothetical protein JST19_22360 [Bacteroidetes bacterium]|nr:hypothetical protein [Bacteroidota bacterium]